MTERSGETAGFDPRFDPAFQPGYRPEPIKPVQPSGSEALRTAVTGEHGHGGAPPLRTTGSADGAASSVGVDGTADVADKLADAPQRRNPFVVALWAISGLITLGGIGMVRWSFTLTEELQTSNTSSQFDYQLSYMLQQAGPLVIVLGLAVATLTVFLHAQAWYGRHAR